MDTLTRHIYEQIVAQNVPPDDARLVLDLATHCREEVLKLIARISDTAPPHLQSNTLILSCVLLQIHLHDAQRDINKLVNDHPEVDAIDVEI